MSINTYVPDDTKILHIAKVDFSRRVSPEKIHLVQYDSGIPVVAVELYNNGKIYILPDSTDLEVKVRWGITNTKFIHKDILGCNEERNKVYFEIDSDLTDIPGTFNPILELVENSNENIGILGSSPMIFIIERNPIPKEMEEI